MPKFQSILSATNATAYDIVKFLVPILETLTHNEFAIKDSFSFANEITTYDSSLYIASFDVEFLFTNIPLNETINNCVNDLYNKDLYSGKLIKRDLFKLIQTATRASSVFFLLPTK